MYILTYTIYKTAYDIVTTPIWWYTTGLLVVLKWFKKSVEQLWYQLGVSLWARHLFTPMFQQYDWQGRIISFFMRVIQLIVRSIGFVVMTLMLGILVCAWVMVPLAVAWLIVMDIYTNFVV